MRTDNFTFTESNLLKFLALKEKSILLFNELTTRIAKDFHDDPLINDAKEVIHSLDSELFNVAVVGVIKRGKSTLLNALLEAPTDILSTQVTPETARLAFLNYAEKPSAVIHTKDQQKIPIEIDELPKYTSAFDTISPRGEKEKVENTLCAEILYPNQILKKGFCIIDTPGVDDPDITRTNVTLNFIEKADAVIFLLSANEGGLKDSELKFLQNKIISNNGTKRGIIVACNMISRLRPRQLNNELPKLLEKNQKLLKDTLGIDIEIFPIDALDALKGIREKNEDLLEKSRFSLFKNHIEDYLVREKGKILLERSTDRFLYSIIAPFKENLETSINSRPNSLIEAEENASKSNEELERLSNHISYITNKYKNEVSQIKVWMQNETKSKLNQLKGNIGNPENFGIQINSKIAELSKVIQNRTNEFFDQMILEIEDSKIIKRTENIAMTKVEVDISKIIVKESIITNQYSEEINMVGKFIGGAFAFFLGGFNPGAIYAGSKVGGWISSIFGGNSEQKEKININYSAINDEIDEVVKKLITSFEKNITSRFNGMQQAISKSLSNKQNRINQRLSKEKEIFENQNSDFELVKMRYQDLLEYINEKENSLIKIKEKITCL